MKLTKTLYCYLDDEELKELESRKEEVEIMLAREKIGRPQLTEKRFWAPQEGCAVKNNVWRKENGATVKSSVA